MELAGVVGGRVEIFWGMDKLGRRKWSSSVDDYLRCLAKRLMLRSNREKSWHALGRRVVGSWGSSNAGEGILCPRSLQKAAILLLR